MEINNNNNINNKDSSSIERLSSIEGINNKNSKTAANDYTRARRTTSTLFLVVFIEINDDGQLETTIPTKPPHDAIVS